MNPKVVVRNGPGKVAVNYTINKVAFVGTLCAYLRRNNLAKFYTEIS